MRRKAAEVSITIWNMNILTAFWIFYILSLMATVLGRLHPECEFIFQLKKDQQRCLKEITENENHTTEGCEQNWDAVMCWPLAAFGETVNVSCPPVFSDLMKNPGTVSRNCTINGWSNPFPPYYLACTIEDEIPVEEESYFATVKVIYTVGYGASIFSLTIAMIILLIFRSLHCARNYVHIQLFASFILRAVAVFIKDATLFANDETEHCTFSTAGCKAAVVFCHYCVMTNFFWLLVEALYLNSLLFSFLHRGRKYFRWFVLLGWGVPTICIIVWIISRMYFEDTECWDVNEISSFWWIIKGPIVVSIGVNFILFINIIRILIQKLDPQLIQFNNSSQYRRLMKSTLLLVPLFGTHYIVFNFLPDYINTGVRLYIELCLGSFQGLIVAVLYCFLNQEVQTEIRRKWMLWYINCYGEVPGVVKESDMDTPF